MEQERLNRQEARHAGLKRYFGKVCERHPDLGGERYISNSACLECIREKQAKYHVKNPEKRRERYSRYYAENIIKERERKSRFRAENPKKEREYQARYRANNCEKMRKRNSRWRSANVEMKKLYEARYRSRLSNAVPDWLTEADRDHLRGLEHLKRAAELSLDHVHPLAGCKCGRIGQHEPGNLVLLTPSENSSKGARCMPCWLATGLPIPNAWVAGAEQRQEALRQWGRAVGVAVPPLPLLSWLEEATYV